MPPISHSLWVLSWSCVPPAMDVAAENAPSCTKPQLYWFPLKAPVEGLWKDWAGTMAESRAQFSQRLQFSSSPYPLSIFQDEITSH